MPDKPYDLSQFQEDLKSLGYDTASIDAKKLLRELDPRDVVSGRVRGFLKGMSFHMIYGMGPKQAHAVLPGFDPKRVSQLIREAMPALQQFRPLKKASQP
jgi:hypothetical protein